MPVVPDFSKPYRVDNGKKFRLKDFDPADTSQVKSKKEAEKELPRGIERMIELQDKLYAQDKWALLVILQAMDAAGKDGVIKHVMSGVSPQGCEVHSFKQPSVEELNHDFMWRAVKNVPERGRIGIFNRSYYEEVLVVRVHKELLERERIPPSLITKNIWNERFADINAYEHYLARNGVVIRKFFLNLSKEEQKKRFLSRLEEPEELEIFRRRYRGARTMGRLHDGLRGYGPEHCHSTCPMVRRSRGQEMVHAPGGGRGDHPCARGLESQVSSSHRCPAKGTEGSSQSTRA